MTLTVTSGNRYTIYIENKFIITELLPCVRQFCDQDKVFLHEKVSVSLDKWEALCILMQYEIELMYTVGINFNSFVQYFLLPNDYYVEIWQRSEFLYNSKFTLTSMIVWNKQCRYKEGWL